MNWTNFFSKIVLINLPSRPDRLLQSSADLDRYSIPFELINAIKRENGQEGIRDTLLGIFKQAIEQGCRNILVFEDDVKILVSHYEFERTMELAILELPTSWEMLYMGANLPNPVLVTEYSAHLLKTKRALALHAVAYSRECMKMILSLPEMLPIDLQIANFINPSGNSFVTYPLLCTQRESISNIEKIIDENGNLVGKKTNNDFYITPRYEKVCEYLNLK